MMVKQDRDETKDRYSTYDVVPPGYNLLDAPPDRLDFYGIPQKPDAVAEPRLFEFWKKLVSPPFAAQKPTFSSMHPPQTMQLDSFTREGKRESKMVPTRGGTLESSLNWSGAVVSPPRPKRIVLAVGGWKAPNVSPPLVPALFTHSNDSRSLVWVGIDGHNGRLPKISLPQIGTGHWPGVPHFAWWDWWKHGSHGGIQVINDFKIEPQHEILAGLAVVASGDVLFFIKNQSTGAFRSFLARLQPLGAIEPLGSSAEWVMERPTEPADNKLYPLPAYGTVEFKHCLALAAEGPNAPGRSLTLEHNGRMVKMREAFANPYRTVSVSRAKRRRDPDGSIGVTCSFHEPT